MKPIVVIWAALLMSSALFIGVLWFVLAPAMAPTAPPVLAWVLVGVAMINVVLSRVFPRMVKAAPEQTKAIISFALAESAVLISGIAWLLTRQQAAFGGVAVGFLALASLFPRSDGETVRLMPPQ